MAVLDALPNKEIIQQMAGVIDYYLWCGKLPVCRTWPKYTYTRTLKQIPRRIAWAMAVWLWQLMPEWQKIPWREKAQGLDKTGYNLFVQDYMLTH